MSLYVDTSAFLAVLDGDDLNHRRARPKWGELVASGDTLVCSNYVLIETPALVQSRMGLDAVRLFQEDVMPVLAVEWVDEASHVAGVGAVLAARQRRLSLVDCVSFHVMRRLGIRTAFAFDAHFGAQGFRCVP